MSDQGIDLDFSGDHGISSDPVPDGVYELRIEDAVVQPTKDQKNKGIKLQFRIDCRDDHPLSKYNGKIVSDWWNLPNKALQTPDNLKTTKGFLVSKLEAVTGEVWADTQRRLVPRSLAGSRFKALVAKVDEGYGPQNKIRRYMPIDSDEQLGFTAPAVPRPQATAGNSSNTPTPEASARFKI